MVTETESDFLDHAVSGFISLDRTSKVCMVILTAIISIQAFIIIRRIGGGAPSPPTYMSRLVKVIWIVALMAIALVCAYVGFGFDTPMHSKLYILMIFWNLSVFWYTLAIVYADVRSGKWKASREQ